MVHNARGTPLSVSPHFCCQSPSRGYRLLARTLGPRRLTPRDGGRRVTLKGQLDLEAHGGKTIVGVTISVPQRLLAIWHNHHTGTPSYVPSPHTTTEPRGIKNLEIRWRRYWIVMDTRRTCCAGSA